MQKKYLTWLMRVLMTLEKFSFKKKTIYFSQSIHDKVNGSLSDKYLIERGAKEGCCLRPILFDIYIYICMYLGPLAI